MIVSTRTYPSAKGLITLVRVTNKSGASVTLSTLGAGIVTVKVPDRDGKIENVALSYENPADYIADGPCMGKGPGRYANRIADGRLVVDGHLFRLPINNGPNHLHGGPEGFQNQNWQYELLPNGVRFSLQSPDGDEGYPGNLTATAEYRWSDDNVLSLSLQAVCDAGSVVNLTNHAYWNLDGADSGSALDHQLCLKASRWLPIDETLIPLGTLADVEETPMDFRAPKALGKDIQADFPALNYGKGYDNCFCLDGWFPGAMIEAAATLRSLKSGRVLTVDTDQPGLQVYTGNWLSGSPLNHAGRSYADYDGVALEAQGWPDAPNRPDFPSQAITPETPYRREIRFRFSTMA